MKKLIIPFAIIANFLIVGCGGGSSYSTVDDGLPTPTAKLKKEQAQSIIEKIQKTRLDPVHFFNNVPYDDRFITINSSQKKMKISSDEENNTESCTNGGTREIKVISGHPEEDAFDKNITSQNYKYQIIYKNCKEDVEINGIKKVTDNWTKKDDTFTYSFKSEINKLVYTKDNKHKLTIQDYILSNSGYYNARSFHDGRVNSKGDSTLEYNAKIVDGDETLELKNIHKVYKFTDKYNEDNDTNKIYEYLSIIGAIKSSKLKGWITVHTPTPYEKTEKDKVETSDASGYCYHKGKLVIKGADHTITQEVASDHTITEKFDNTTIKKYKNCIEYYK